MSTPKPPRLESAYPFPQGFTPNQGVSGAGGSTVTKEGGSRGFGAPGCTAEGEQGFLQFPFFGAMLCHLPPPLRRETVRRILVLTKFGFFYPIFLTLIRLFVAGVWRSSCPHQVTTARAQMASGHPKISTFPPPWHWTSREPPPATARVIFGAKLQGFGALWDPTVKTRVKTRESRYMGGNHKIRVP